MDLRQLRYFVAIVRSGSFVGASRELHISQPALGYQIKRLEAELGVELLLRHSRGVLLTEPGQVLLSHARDVLERMSRTERAMDGFRNGLSGEITLGVTPTCGRILAPELLERCASHPNLRISLRQGLSNELFQATLAGQLDMTFCYDPHFDDPSRVTALYRERLFLTGPPDMLQEFNETVPFSRLGQVSILDNRSGASRHREHAQALGATPMSRKSSRESQARDDRPALHDHPMACSRRDQAGQLAAMPIRRRSGRTCGSPSIGVSCCRRSARSCAKKSPMAKLAGKNLEKQPSFMNYRSAVGSRIAGAELRVTRNIAPTNPMAPILPSALEGKAGAASGDRIDLFAGQVGDFAEGHSFDLHIGVDLHVDRGEDDLTQRTANYRAAVAAHQRNCTAAQCGSEIASHLEVGDQ